MTPRCALCGWPTWHEDLRLLLHRHIGQENLCLGCAWSNPDSGCPCCRDEVPTVEDHEQRLRAALKEG